MMQNVHTKLHPRLSWQKQHSTKKTLFTTKLLLNFQMTYIRIHEHVYKNTYDSVNDRDSGWIIVL